MVRGIWKRVIGRGRVLLYYTYVQKLARESKSRRLRYNGMELCSVWKKMLPSVKYKTGADRDLFRIIQIS